MTEFNRAWADTWLTAVRDGAGTMSQRKLATIQVVPGRLESAIVVARELGLHLTVFTDESGVELLVASVHPVRVLV